MKLIDIEFKPTKQRLRFMDMITFISNNPDNSAGWTSGFLSMVRLMASCAWNPEKQEYFSYDSIVGKITNATLHEMSVLSSRFMDSMEVLFDGGVRTCDAKDIKEFFGIKDKE